MDKLQVRWAKQHDWFLSSFMNSDGTYTVRVYDSLNNKSVEFTECESLYIWAGY